jgi:hypothetical protein
LNSSIIITSFRRICLPCAILWSSCKSFSSAASENEEYGP